MSSLTHRRDFLKTAALATMPAAAASLGAATAHAIEPLKRNGAAKFKFSLAAYSYRNLLKSGKLTMADFVSSLIKTPAPFPLPLNAVIACLSALSRYHFLFQD